MDDPKSKSKKQSDTKDEPPDEKVVFFVDRCLGRGVWNALRQYGLNAEHKDDHFAQNTEDSVWMTEIGKRGWVVLTRDTRIRVHPHERQALFRANVRFFSLQTKRGADGRRGITGREMTEIILARMPDILKLVRETPAPIVAGITRDRVRLMDRPSSSSQSTDDSK